MEDDQQVLDAERALEALTRIFERVQRFSDEMARSADGGGIAPGSALSGDDKKSAYFQVSFYAWHLICTANEHLHSLKLQMVDAKVLPRAPAFTVVRGAIEAAATARWMLMPNQRRERLRRRFALQYKEAGYSIDARKSLGATTEAPSVKEKIMTIARARCGDQIRLTVPNHTAMLREVDETLDEYIHPSILGTWQLCSGFAHGYQWSGLALFSREEVRQRTGGVIDARSTNSEIAVYVAAHAAEFTMMAAMRRFQLLAHSTLLDDYCEG